MSAEQRGKAWKGTVASLILWGAGPFFSGARRRGLGWFAVSYLGGPGLLFLYSLSFVTAKSAPVLLVLALLVWVIMLYDSYRPIRPLHWWGWILLVATSVAFSGLSSIGLHRFFDGYHAPTASMAPTIQPGDDLLVSRCAYWFSPPQRGDIIVFDASAWVQKGPSEKEVMFNKRIVGLPGDSIEILDPAIRINGIEMKFGGTRNPIEYHRLNLGEAALNGKEEYHVPAGQYFVLGDHSARSYDSRHFGAVPRGVIYGKIVKIYWPFSRTSTPR